MPYPPPRFTWDGCIMNCYAVHLFYCAVKIDGAGAGFYFNMWPLRGVLGKLFLQYFVLFCKVPEAMQQPFLKFCLANFSDGLHFCLALTSAAHIGVGRQGGFSSLSFAAMTGTVGIFPNWSFRCCPTFVYISATSIISNM